MDNFHNFFNFLEFFSSLGKAHNKIMHSSSQGDLWLNLGFFLLLEKGEIKTKVIQNGFLIILHNLSTPHNRVNRTLQFLLDLTYKMGKVPFKAEFFFIVSRNIAKSKRNDSVSLHFVLKQKKYSKRKWDTLVPLSRLH